MESNDKIIEPKDIEIDGNEFLLFKDANPNPLVPPKGCRDSLHAKCISGGSLSECMSVCARSKECGFGYYIDNGTKQTCLPIYTGDMISYKFGHGAYPEANPIYYIRDKSNFENSKRANTATFIRKTKNWFPDGKLPDEANTVFFGDKVRLQDTFGNELALIQGTDSLFDAKMQAKGTDVQLLYTFVITHLDKLDLSDHVSIVQGDQVSSIVLEDSVSGNLVGAPHRNWKQNENSAFQILPVNYILNKGHLVYGDPFMIKIGDRYVASNTKEKKLSLLPDTISEWGKHIHPPSFHNRNVLARDLLPDYGLIFTFEPRKNVYYCENGKCKTVKLSETSQKGTSATYNGKVCYIHPKCFYSCDWGNSQSTSDSIKKGDRGSISTPELAIIICSIVVIASSLMLRFV